MDRHPARTGKEDISVIYFGEIRHGIQFRSGKGLFVCLFHKDLDALQIQGLDDLPMIE